MIPSEGLYILQRVQLSKDQNDVLIMLMMITGISVQCGAVHCRTGSEVDITRMSVDNHPYLRSLLVSIQRKHNGQDLAVRMVQTSTNVASAPFLSPFTFSPLLLFSFYFLSSSPVILKSSHES